MTKPETQTETTKNIQSGAKWVVITQIASKVISICSMFFLYRLITPEHFGVFALTNVSIQFIRLFGNFGISSAIIHKQDQSKDFLNQAFYLHLLISIILFILTFILAIPIGNFYDSSLLKSTIYLVSISFLFSPFEIIPFSILQIQSKFKEITTIPVFIEILLSIISVIMAFAGFGIWSLVMPMVMAGPIRSIIYMKLAKWKPSIINGTNHWPALFHFGKHLFISNINTYLTTNIDYIIVGKILGKGILGIYQFSYNWANWPVTNLVMPFYKVLFPSFSNLKDDLFELKSSYLKIIKFISMLTFPIFTFILIFTHNFIMVVAGDNWLEAIIPTKIMISYGLIRAIGSPGGQLLVAIGKPKVMSIYSTILIPFLIIALIIGVNFQIIGVSIAVSIVLSIGSLVFIALTLINTKIKIYDYLKILMPTIFVCLLSGILTWIISIYFSRYYQSIYLNLAAKGIFFSIFYIFNFYLIYNKQFTELISNLKQNKS